jgi:hypothetical protein
MLIVKTLERGQEGRVGVEQKGGCVSASGLEVVGRVLAEILFQTPGRAWSLNLAGRGDRGTQIGGENVPSVQIRSVSSGGNLYGACNITVIKVDISASQISIFHNIIAHTPISIFHIFEQNMWKVEKTIFLPSFHFPHCVFR